MATATTQSKRIRAEKKAAVQAEAKVAEELAKSKRRTAKKDGWPCTADDIIRERDTRSLSWKQVAVNLNLGSPGQARKAYADLTGVPHYESQMTGKRASKGAGVGRKIDAPDWDADSDQDEIIERLQGRWHEPTKDSSGHYDGSLITVKHDYRGLEWEEECAVSRVAGFAFEGEDEHLVITVYDRETGAARAFNVQDIVAVR